MSEDILAKGFEYWGPFGMVVALLIVGIIITYRQWMYWQNKYTENLKETTVILNDVNKYLNDNINTPADLQTIKEELRELKIIQQNNGK
jgi:predicted negative regulator of RcsB-dependent stress response